MKSLEEKKVDGKLVFDGKVVKLCVDNVLLPDNSKSVREVVRHSGGAAVLLVDGDDVILVRQFRYAYNKELLEIPAGKLNLGEDPALAAQRELEEETGYKATLSHALDIFPRPATRTKL